MGEPKLTPRQEQVLAAALRRAYNTLREKHKPVINAHPSDSEKNQYEHDLNRWEAQLERPRDIVFEAIAQAMETLSRVPDREKGWLKGGQMWPEINTCDDERRVLYYEILMLIEAGRMVNGELVKEVDDRFSPRKVPTSLEITRMDVVFDAMRPLFVGRQPLRDWKMICLLSAGRAPAAVARTVKWKGKAKGVNRDRAVLDRKLVQCGAVAEKLWRYMPVQV